VHFVGESRTKKNYGSNKGLGRFRATFDETLDCEQVGHLKLLESCLFGLTYTEVRQLSYQLAEKNGIDPGLNRQKMPGWDRIVGFKKPKSSYLPEETRGYFSSLSHGFQ
jgi:hypothetical protein